MRTIEPKLYKLKDGRHQVSYYHPAKRRRVRYKFDTLKDAKRHAKEISLQIQAQNLHERMNLPVGKLIEIHLRENPKSRFTERKNVFIAFCDYFGMKPLSDLSKKELEKWFAEMKTKNHYSDRNMFRLKSLVNVFMKWLLEEELILSNPLTLIKFNRRVQPTRDRVILSEGEVKELLSELHVFSPKVLHPFIYAILHTGARRSEIMKLTWNDVDLRMKLIHFRKTKNGDSRTVRMSDGLFRFLQGQHRLGEFVFHDGYGRQMNRGKLQRLIYSFKERHPQTKDWRCHDLRHTFAYHFLKKGGEMYQLKAILGHRTIQMTVDLYGNLKAADVDNVSPFDF